MIIRRYECDGCGCLYYSEIPWVSLVPCFECEMMGIRERGESGWLSRAAETTDASECLQKSRRKNKDSHTPRRSFSYRHW